MSTQTRRPWSIEEDQAIRSIVNDIGTKHWSDISKAMQEKYRLFGRSGKQCRQRWHNHLAPDVNKKPWSKEEEEILFQAHKKHGNKWTEISKLIEGRTDNAIKNHFYSSIRRSLRRINKILGSKNSTVKMRNVKPAALSAIFSIVDKEEQTNNQDYKDLASALIDFSRNRVNKNTNLITGEQKEGLESLIKKLMEFNDNYENDKKTTKKPQMFERIQKGNSLILTSKKQKISQASQGDDVLGEDQSPCEQQQNLSQQPSLAHQQIEQFEDNTKVRMTLQESEYDWSEFQQRCQTIINKYLVSQNSLKSMESLPVQQNYHPLVSNNKAQQTPIKSQKQSLCFSTDVITFQNNQKGK